MSAHDDRLLGAVAAISAEHRIVSVVIPADPLLDGAAILAALPQGARSMWWHPEEDVVVAGAGRVAALCGAPHSPLDQITRFGGVSVGGLDVGVVDLDDTGVRPVLIGGFSFFADDVWEAFGPGDLVLPEIAYVRRDGRAAWVVTFPSGAAPDIMATIDTVSREVSPVAVTTRSVADPVLEDPHRTKTQDLVSATIDRIEDGRLTKVVLAHTVAMEGTADVPGLVAVLADRYAGCVTFAYERSGEWFVGASPELLVRKRGATVGSAAVAATAPRHDDPAEDAELMAALRTTKQLEEHRLVVDAIAGALSDLGVETRIEPQQIMELRRVRHLATPIGGEAPAGLSLLDLVGALHPTPAVGGVPGSGALEWIRDNEPFTRGWYAAPVGFVDLDGDGEFRVALRSARVTGEAIHLYAGAGIVAGSDPAAEMDEIDLKLGVMAGAVATAR